jgi:hypothetical protein
MRIAFGLIREAVGTEAGQEVINKVGSAIRKDSSANPPPETVDIEARLAEHRAQVDRNIETMVQMLNAQGRQLVEMNRRQRIWNIALASAVALVLIAVVVVYYALL